jgi:hypothetical protein
MLWASAYRPNPKQNRIRIRPIDFNVTSQKQKEKHPHGTIAERNETLRYHNRSGATPS